MNPEAGKRLILKFESIERREDEDRRRKTLEGI